MKKYSTVDVQHKLCEMALAKKLTKLNEWLEKHLTLSVPYTKTTGSILIPK